MNAPFQPTPRQIMQKHTHNSPYYGNITIIADDQVWFEMLPETKELLARLVNSDYSVSHALRSSKMTFSERPDGYVFDRNASTQMAYYKDVDTTHAKVTALTMDTITKKSGHRLPGH